VATSTLIIKTGLAFPGKDAALEAAAALLCEAGCVDADYVESFKKREYITSTYLDRGLAVPHGTQDDLGKIKKEGIAFLQIPSGVEWGKGQTATLVAAIAAPPEKHLLLMRDFVKLLQNKEVMASLKTESDGEKIRALFLPLLRIDNHLPPA
jgi:phosphocarrier protein FPr